MDSAIFIERHKKLGGRGGGGLHKSEHRSVFRTFEWVLLISHGKFEAFTYFVRPTGIFSYTNAPVEDNESTIFYLGF